MDAKAPSSSHHTHVETRLSFDSISSPIVCIQLPSNSTFARTSKSSRRVINLLPNSQNEEEYRFKRLASSSGVYFRTRKRYPRSISWRCLEDNKVVELRSLDLSKDKDEQKEADVVLRIGFPSHIIKDGVAVTDSADEDVISLFVLTTANELYTISLKPVLFCKTAASEDDFDRFVKIFKPASLSIASAFRFKATSAHEVFIGLADGRIVKLSRKAGQDGSNWDEIAYSDGQWGSSLRGLIRWSAGSSSVSYEGATLDHNTALGMVLSPNSSHLYCVGLNHTLKVWNLQTGRVNISRDILDIERDPSETQKVLVHPSNSKLLAMFECSTGFDGDLHYLVTFSPHSSGVFKFWGIRDPDSAEYGIRDLFENDVLRAPEPDDGAAWTLTDFCIQTEPSSSNIGVWILMKLNKRYRIFKRSFVDLKSIGSDWSDGWSIVKVNAASKEPVNEGPIKISNFDAQSVPEKWLEFVLSPGRYAEATLETALTLYIESRGLQPQKNNRIPIQDRIASTVGSSVHLTEQSDGSFDNFNEKLGNEWSSFWRTVEDIDHSHWDPLSLGFDHLEDTPYTIFSAGFAVIRDLSDLESLAYNTSTDLQNNQDLSITQSIEIDDSMVPSASAHEQAAVIEAAAIFRASFSSALKASAVFELQNEAWKDASLSIPERIQQFYDACDFGEEIGDRVYDIVISKLRANDDLSYMRTDVLTAILASSSNELPKEDFTRPGTKMGTKILSRGVTDLIAVQERILADLLYLIVFLVADGDMDGIAPGELNSNLVYANILNDIRKIQMIKWLVSNRSRTPLDHQSTASGMLKDSMLPPSILEQDFITSVIHPRAAISQSQSTALTLSIRDVETYVCGNNEIGLAAAVLNIQCILIKRGDIDLASSFVQFQSSTPLDVYVRGRLHLVKQEFTDAAQYFQKAAFQLSRTKPAGLNLTEMSSGLIQQTEQNLFGTGLANFYAHVVSLFSSHQANGQISNFAELALRHCNSTDQSLRSDLLARLFHASVALSEWSIAYATLVRYTDKALQRSALAELVTRMISNEYVEELLFLPFTTLKKDVVKILSEKADREIGLSAKATPKTPYFKILYAFHVRHKDFRAAASVLVSRLEARHEQRSKNAKQHRFLNSKQETEKALDEYLVGINALALLGPEDDEDDQDEAWVFVEGEETASGGKKRRVMRIEGLRDRYQSEMDRIAAIELGRWGIVDEDEEDEMDGIEQNGTLVSA